MTVKIAIRSTKLWQKAVKLADIARTGRSQHGNSVKSTVRTKGVSEEVREKIHSIAEELGYQQPSAARKVRTRRATISAF